MAILVGLLAGCSDMPTIRVRNCRQAFDNIYDCEEIPRPTHENPR